MFKYIQQDFILLLNFSVWLARKCISLNNEPCLVRPPVIDLNPKKVLYYPFMISLERCSRSCNT